MLTYSIFNTSDMQFSALFTCVIILERLTRQFFAKQFILINIATIFLKYNIIYKKKKTTVI